jgi:glycosyltransferase involved in cell wall biosynthesis
VRAHSDVARKMQESIAIVNPSIREGFGLVLLEAMASGTPPIAYNLEAYADFADKSNSILIAQGDWSGLADAINELLENRKYWSLLSKRGIKAAGRMSWGDIVKRIERFYSGLI